MRSWYSVNMYKHPVFDFECYRIFFYQFDQHRIIETQPVKMRLVSSAGNNMSMIGNAQVFHCGINHWFALWDTQIKELNTVCYMTKIMLLLSERRLVCIILHGTFVLHGMISLHSINLQSFKQTSEMNTTSKIIIAVLIIGLMTSLAINMQQAKDHKDIKRVKELRSATVRSEITNAKEELATAERNLFLMREIQYAEENSMMNKARPSRTISTRIDSVFLNIGSSLDSINRTLQRIDSLER